MFAFAYNDVIVCAGFRKHELLCVTCMNLFYYQYICIPINSAQCATMWVTYVMLSHLDWFGICCTGEDERNKRKKSERT